MPGSCRDHDNDLLSPTSKKSAGNLPVTSKSSAGNLPGPFSGVKKSCGRATAKKRGKVEKILPADSRHFSRENDSFLSDAAAAKHNTGSYRRTLRTGFTKMSKNSGPGRFSRFPLSFAGVGGQKTQYRKLENHFLTGPQKIDQNRDFCSVCRKTSVFIVHPRCLTPDTLRTSRRQVSLPSTIVPGSTADRSFVHLLDPAVPLLAVSYRLLGICPDTPS